MLVASIMVFTLVACGSNEAKVTTNSEEVVQSTENETNVITDTKWISLYNGNVMTLNNDGSLEFGENKGTWEQDGDTLTLKYKVSTSGDDLELYADILEENGIAIIRTQKSGKVNGSSSNFSISSFVGSAGIPPIF